MYIRVVHGEGCWRDCSVIKGTLCTIKRNSAQIPTPVSHNTYDYVYVCTLSTEQVKWAGTDDSWDF